jgi:hypothetical protein
VPTLPTRATSRDEFVDDAAASIVDRDQGSAHLFALLGALLADTTALASWLASLDPVEVAERSYWHHNGFAKLVLHAEPDFRVRLHVWPAGPDRLGEVNPHGHRWDFASSVLCGAGLRSTTYGESVTGRSFVRHDYVGNGRQARLVPGCNIGLAVRDCTDVGTHDRYVVTTETVHTIDPLGTSIVATLVVQGPPLLTSTPVYCAPGTEADQPGRSILAAEVRELTGALLAAPDGPWDW